MSHQDEIYNQNGNGERNQTVGVVNTSSDICVFNMPFFSMSGASKIACDTETCDIGGVAYNNILTATTECFTTAAMSADCFTSVVWTTKLYEDNALVYSDTFYTSTNVSDAPSVIDFSGSVVTSFSAMDYDYSFSGTQYSVEQKGFKELRVDINTSLNYVPNCNVTGNTTDDTSCSCPSGTTATTSNDACQSFNYTAATTGSTATAIAGDTYFGFDSKGASFHANIDDYTWPLEFSGNTGVVGAYSGTNFIVDANQNLVPAKVGGPGLTYYDKPVVQNGLWGSGTISSGRMNNAGIKSSPAVTLEFIGFSYCVDIEESGTYYVGMGADDRFRFKLDGETVFNQINAIGGLKPPYNVGLSLYIQHYWVFEMNLTSGKHIFDLEYYSSGGLENMTMEIYSGTSIEALSAMTSEPQLSAVTIFSTANEIGNTFNIGETYGFGCPTGYTYDVCYTGGTRCVQIVNEDINCIYTGDCSGDVTEVICDLDYTGLTVDAQNIHCLSGQTAITMEFTFTANTSEFIDTNTTFMFEVFKYNHDFGYFQEPSIYQSEEYLWPSFSATSAFTTSLPVSSLNVDGDYLIKGYYVHDVCTEFALLNGDKLKNPTNNIGDKYRLYQSYKDFYFLAFDKAGIPSFEVNDDNIKPFGSLQVFGFVLDGTETEITLPESRGDYIISLNGLTLTETLDYEISATTLDTGTIIRLNLNGDTFNGDVLTYAWTNAETRNNIRSEGFEITSVIESGTTGNQGSNSVYYNTTTNKFELYLDLTPVNGNDIIVTLNGVTLANNIDYYQSISDSKRIILNGDLLIGDVVNMYYVTNNANQGDVTSTSFTINWSIPSAPQTTNGLFTIEFSNDKDFSTLLPTSATTEYVIGQTLYNKDISLSGSVGDVQYYRVKNVKGYTDICGNDISTTAYSETVDITIQTNAFNSY